MAYPQSTTTNFAGIPEGETYPWALWLSPPDPSQQHRSLLPALPNWRDPYNVRLEFRTDIFTSRSGREQRRALRQTPRQQFAYTITTTTEDMRAFERFVYRYHDKQIVVPDLLRFAETTTDMPANARTMVLDSVPGWLVLDACVVLVAGQQQSQRRVTGIEGNTVTFGVESPENWPIGTRVHPAIAGRMDSEISVTQLTDEVSELSMSVAAVPGLQQPDDGEAEEFFNGREVLTLEHNWVRPVSGSHTHMVDTVDFGRGRTQTVSPIAFGTRINQFGFTLATTTEVQYLTQFFRRMKGQLGEFYVSSPSTDLMLLEPVDPDGTLLKFAGTDIAETYSDDTVHRAVMIWVDGIAFPFSRKIAQIINTGTQSVIELETEVGATLDPATTRITWLRASRFAVDLLELRAATDCVAEAQIAVKSLEDLTAEGTIVLDEGAQWLIDRFGWRFTKNVIADPLDHFINATWPNVSESIP